VARLLASLVIAAVLLFDPSAHAETVTLQRRTRVLSKPADSGDEVTEVRSGKKVKVLRRGDGWIKIRVGGQVGWIPRSQIDEPDEEEDRVADLDEDEGLEEEDEEEEQADDDEELPDGGEAEASVAKKKGTAEQSMVGASAALGVSQLTTAFRSDGAMELGNYRLESRAYTAALDVDVTVWRSGEIAAIGDARYQGSVASPGVHFEGTPQTTGDVPFTTHEMEGGLRLAYSFSSFRASGRLGYHYDLFVVQYDNVGKLPREALSGAVVGARVELPFTGSGWSARAGIDYLTGGKRSQTKGLDDGAPQRATARWAEIAIGYALTGKVAAELGFRHTRAITTWSGPSGRQPDVTSANRTDLSKQLTIGLSQAF
jgi:hypothetical protein